MRKVLFSLMFFFGGLASEMGQPAGRPCAVPSSHAWLPPQRPKPPKRRGVRGAPPP